jgi:hypothetical protein
MHVAPHGLPWPGACPSSCMRAPAIQCMHCAVHCVSRECSQAVSRAHCAVPQTTKSWTPTERLERQNEIVLLPFGAVLIAALAATGAQHSRLQGSSTRGYRGAALAATGEQHSRLQGRSTCGYRGAALAATGAQHSRLQGSSTRSYRAAALAATGEQHSRLQGRSTCGYRGAALAATGAQHSRLQGSSTRGYRSAALAATGAHRSASCVRRTKPSAVGGFQCVNTLYVARSRRK